MAADAEDDIVACGDALRTVSDSRARQSTASGREGGRAGGALPSCF
jgi:hypothetical protein